MNGEISLHVNSSIDKTGESSTRLTKVLRSPFSVLRSPFSVLRIIPNSRNILIPAFLAILCLLFTFTGCFNPTNGTSTTYTVSITQTSGGTLAVSKTGASPASSLSGVAAGEIITVTVTPDQGKVYSAGTLKYQGPAGQVSIPDDTLKFVMPAGNVTVSAVFAAAPPDTYTVTVVQSGGGTLYVSKSGSGPAAILGGVTEGEIITVTVIPDQEKRLKAASLKYNGPDGEEPIPENTKQFIMPAGNVTVSAEFEAIPTGDGYTVSTNQVSGGTITVSRPGAGPAATLSGVPEAEIITVIVTPNPGQRCVLGSINYEGQSGQVFISDTTKQFSMPAGNVTVSAEFVPLGYLASSSDLAGIGNDPGLPMNGSYTLYRDISLPADWAPVGNIDKPFTGSLDGANKTITVTGFRISVECFEYGVFGRTNGALIKNLKFHVPSAIILDFGIVYIESGFSVGIVVGRATNTKLDNIQVYGAGSLSASMVTSPTVISKSLEVGGIAGRAQTEPGGFTKISNASVSIGITSDLAFLGDNDSMPSEAGGIVGRVSDLSLPVTLIEDCSSSGPVSGYGRGSRTLVNAGGIAGRIRRGPDGTQLSDYGGITDEMQLITMLIAINNCHATGTIKAESSNDLACAGGIAGRQLGFAIIMNSWASGNISASSLKAEANAGGIVGRNRDSAIGYCYYKTGKVMATGQNWNKAGGITGFNMTNQPPIPNPFGGSGGLRSIISECYSTGEVEAQGSAGGIAGENSTASLLQYCFSTGLVLSRGAPLNSTPCAGGIAGANYAGQTDAGIESSYALGQIKIENASGGSIGGIVGAGGGIINSCAAINKSIAVSNISGTPNISRVGPGFSGYNVAYEDMTLTGASNWSDPTFDNPYGRNGLGLPLADLKKPATPGTSVYETGLDWHFTGSNATWKWSTNAAYPYPILQWMPDNSNPAQ